MIYRINTLNLLRNLCKSHFVAPKVNPLVVRNASTDNSVSNLDSSKWQEIYRLPLIRLASGFLRLKVYQTLVTAVGTPIAFSLETAGAIDPGAGIVFAALGFTGILTLTLCSFPIKHLIGFVYINESEDRVKLAYVDFWGRRQNQELVIDDILGQWELPQRRINIYQRIKSRNDASVSFKLLYRYGVISDPERYVSVFGDENI